MVNFLTIVEITQESYDFSRGRFKDKIRELGVKEVVDQYFESFEFITNDGKYIEICGVY